MSVKAKKYLGQHFLKDENIARDIVNSLSLSPNLKVIEVGPGMGVLTKYMVDKNLNLSVVELDSESVLYLNEKYNKNEFEIIESDFLKIDFNRFNSENIAIIGNFPYNISSQIVFKILDNKNIVTQMVGMFQREVALRIASEKGNKIYGILSVLVKAFYDVEYLFTVDENVFSPPPKVKSAVIKLTRKDNLQINCDEILFKKVIKMAFGLRRKTLRNSLKPMVLEFEINTENDIFSKRPEQLSVIDFVNLTNLITFAINKNTENKI